MTSRTLTAMIAAAGLGIALTACGDDDGGEQDSAMGSDSATPAPMETVGPEQAMNTAVITLADGQMLTTGVECVLEPHTFEGQAVLYRATMEGNPLFNVAAFDEGADFEGSILTWDEFEDETRTTLLDAWGGGPVFETDFTTTLQAMMITGSGTLVQGGPEGLTGESQIAELEVVCDG